MSCPLNAQGFQECPVDNQPIESVSPVIVDDYTGRSPATASNGVWMSHLIIGVVVFIVLASLLRREAPEDTQETNSDQVNPTEDNRHE